MFWQRVRPLKEKVEISPFAELCDNVAVIDAEMNILASDDMGVVELSQNVDLALEKPASDFALDITGSYFFNSDYRVVVQVGTLKHLAEAAFTHFVTQVKHVVLNFLCQMQQLTLVGLHFARQAIDYVNYLILYQPYATNFMQITLYYSPFLHLFRAIFHTIADPKFFSFFIQGKSQNSELFNLLAQKTKI